MADGRNGPLAPRLEHGIHLGGGAADLGGGDFQPAELLEDLGHSAGGDALEIHLGDGHDQSALAALAALEGAGIEGLIAVADLGHVQFKRAEAGVERASFEAVGVAVAGRGTLVGSGAQMPVALDEHGVVDQERDGLGQAVEASGEDGVENFIGQANLVLFGHGCVRFCLG